MGRPRPVVTSWNDDKLVGLFEYSADLCCGAAVGNDVTQAARDFKACCLPLSGKTKCTAGTHVGPRTKRVLRPVGDFAVAIAVPSSAATPKQIFSRPMLDAADLRHITDTPEWGKLMSIRMEPRVWKLVLELFPGSYVLADHNQPFLQQPPKPKPSVPVASMSQPVSDAPILSPRAGVSTNPQSFQRDTGEGWNFDDDAMSGPAGAGGGVLDRSGQPTLSAQSCRHHPAAHTSRPSIMQTLPRTGKLLWRSLGLR